MEKALADPAPERAPHHPPSFHAAKFGNPRRGFPTWETIRERRLGDGQRGSKAECAFHGGELRDGEAEVGARMGGADLRADARFSLRDDGK